MRAPIRPLVLGIAGTRTAAGDEKLDMKFLIGTWMIKYFGGKTEDEVEQSIEFKEDGTYLWNLGGIKMEGSYELTGTTPGLTKKGTKTTTIWKDLSIKDGKLTQPVGKTAYKELTRIEKK